MIEILQVLKPDCLLYSSS